MDTSEEFIEMCKKLPDEIKQLWEPNIGDYYAWNEAVSVMGQSDFKSVTRYEIRDKNVWGNKDEYGKHIIGYYKEWVVMDFSRCSHLDCEEIIHEYQAPFKEYKNCIWLPRQDQLQEILMKHVGLSYSDPGCLIGMAGYLDIFIDINIEYICRTNFTSMEQLWLAFIVYEKYELEWNTDRKEWI